MDGINFFYQGSGIKILGKIGLRDQNNGKKIGINGSRIYHVTTLTKRSHYVMLPCLLAKFLDLNKLWPCDYVGEKNRLYDFPVIALRTFLSSFDNANHEMAISVSKEGLLRSRNLVTMVK